MTKRNHIFKNIIALSLISAMTLSVSYAQDSTNKSPENAVVDTLVVFDEIDDPIVDQWDSLVTEIKKDESVLFLDSAVYALFKKTPTFTDEEYIEMMAILDAQSPFSLDYNKRIRQSINYYTKQGRAGTSKVLGKAELYFPMMEEILYKNGLPLEFKYLSIVESCA